jgi:hypothetical protein
MLTQIIDGDVKITFREPLTEIGAAAELWGTSFASAEEYPKHPIPGTKWPSERKAPWNQIEAFTLGRHESCRLFQAVRARSRVGKGQTVSLVLGIPTIVKEKGKTRRFLSMVW